MVKAMICYIIDIGGNICYTSKVWLEPPKLALHCYCQGAATTSHPILE